MKSNLFLWLHDERYSKTDLIVNPEYFVCKIGDLLEITKGNRTVLLKVEQLEQDPKSQLQISISQHIASHFDLVARQHVSVSKVDREQVTASHIEVAFREQYIGRSDMWVLKSSLNGKPVYSGEKVSSLGVRGSIKDIYVNGSLCQSGYITEQTKIIFRSETAKYFIFIQMSKEMWEFDEDGDMFLGKCVHGFLPELFKRWKETGTNHVVSFVLFARILYHEVRDRNFEFHQDALGRPCRDFYRVVVDWETSSDWNSMLIPLKKELIQFQRDVLQQQDSSGSTVLSGSNSTAPEGNILEAVNLALNPFDKHYVDRDLSRTGLSIVVITAGTGIYEVDRALCRMTSQRMTDNGISLDLVCLSKPPLHTAPIFQFVGETSNDAERGNNLDGFQSPVHGSHTKSEKGFGPRSFNDKPFQSYESSNMTFSHATKRLFFYYPKWIECSYWSKEEAGNFLPRCKMYEVQMMGIFDQAETKIDVPYLDWSTGNSEEKILPHDIGKLCSLYDNAIFCFDNVSLQQKANEAQLFHTYTDYKSELKGIKSYISGDAIETIMPFQEHSDEYNTKQTRIMIPLGRSPGNWASFDRIMGKEQNNISESMFSTSIQPIKIESSNMTYSKSASPHRASFSGSEKESGKAIQSLKTTATTPRASLLTCNLAPWNAELQDSGESRWEHIFPKHQGQLLMALITHWKSLCTPACLPLTTEYIPSADELLKNYQEFTYTVSPNEDSSSFQPSKLQSSKVEAFLIELVKQRLAQGFQLIVSPVSDISQIPNIIGFSEETGTVSKPYFVSLGDHIHKLSYDSSGSNVEVKRYIKKVFYNTAPIKYHCAIWPKYQSSYEQRSIEFTYPPLVNYNWNYLDHLISGYQEQLTENLRFWRMRYLLIPMETLPQSLSTSDNETLDDEETRIAGFKRFIESFEKARFQASNEKSSKLLRSIDITYTTLNVHTLVSNESVKQPLKLTSPVSNSDRLLKTMPLASIASAMQNLQGLSIQDRRWHFKVYEQVFVGEECVDWLIKRFSDIDSREAAVDFGNTLLQQNVIEHINSKHKFLDGFYFYRIGKEYTTERKEKVSQSNSANWFYRKHSRYDLGASVDSSAEHSIENGSLNESMPLKVKSKAVFAVTKQMPLDMDPYKKSSRREIAVLHHDTTMNPKNCYHFQIHWLVCTARLIEDMLYTWTRIAEKNGFKLVEAPVDQPRSNNDTNPFLSLIPIKFAKPPPACDSESDQFYETELLKEFNFVLDSESDDFFEPDSVEFSYHRKSYAYTQFIHRSGVAFVQVLPRGQGLLWINNRLHLANSRMLNLGLPTSPSSIRAKLEEFCQNADTLCEFWKLKQKEKESN